MNAKCFDLKLEHFENDDINNHRISLPEFSSITNPKRTAIVAFKNVSGVNVSQQLSKSDYFTIFQIH